MSILITAMALAATPASAAVQPPPAAPAMQAQHAQHSQSARPGAKPQGEGCSCCRDMARGAKMDCCAKHGEGHGEHSEHDAGH